jgi:hypothetical protein
VGGLPPPQQVELGGLLAAQSLLFIFLVFLSFLSVFGLQLTF